MSNDGQLLKLHNQYDNILEYVMKKAKLPLWKAFLYGVLGGLFVGLGYLGYHLIISGDFVDPSGNVKEPNANTFQLNKTVAALIFPVGLMLVIFLGGSLFTSNNLMFFARLEKKVTTKKIAVDWSIVWIGNLCGTTLIASLTYLGGFYDGAGMTAAANYFAEHKAVAADWWEYFFSAIGCNLLVAGTVGMAFYFKSAVGKLLIIFFGIWLFAISGFQHIVANFYAFIIAGYRNTSADPGVVIYANLIPTTIGNAIGGGFIIPIVYWLLNKKRSKKEK